jgi:hypothetical protein
LTEARGQLLGPQPEETTMARTRPESLTWIPNPDGEPDAVTTTYRGHTIEVFSDGRGFQWMYVLDDEATQFGKDTREGAMREAIADIDSIEEG